MGTGRVRWERFLIDMKEILTNCSLPQEWKAATRSLSTVEVGSFCPQLGRQDASEEYSPQYYWHTFCWGKRPRALRDGCYHLRVGHRWGSLGSIYREITLLSLPGKVHVCGSGERGVTVSQTQTQEHLYDFHPGSWRAVSELWRHLCRPWRPLRFKYHNKGHEGLISLFW